MMFSKEFWMTLALKEANKALKIQEVPVGAIVVYNNKIIGSGFNQVINLKDATAHAEIIALRNAADIKNNYRLNFCDIYSTLEPCIMCLGAMINFRIRKLYFGAKQKKSGVIVSRAKLHKANFLNHKIEIEGEILSVESIKLLHDFFKTKRKSIEI